MEKFVLRHDNAGNIPFGTLADINKHRTMLKIQYKIEDRNSESVRDAEKKRLANFFQEKDNTKDTVPDYIKNSKTVKYTSTNVLAYQPFEEVMHKQIKLLWL